MIGKLEGFTDQQEKLIDEIKEAGMQQQDQLNVGKRGSGGFDLMPRLFNGIKEKLSLSAMQQELDEMMKDPNGNVDAKLMRLDALINEKFTKMQRLIDTKLDKRDFNYFEGVFGKETLKIAGLIEQDKHDKEEMNQQIQNMEDHVRSLLHNYYLVQENIRGCCQLSTRNAIASSKLSI